MLTDLILAALVATVTTAGIAAAAGIALVLLALALTGCIPVHTPGCVSIPPISN